VLPPVAELPPAPPVVAPVPPVALASEVGGSVSGSPQPNVSNESDNDEVSKMR
jgi:hypothetical protein